jgi:hypothetical protein
LASAYPVTYAGDSTIFRLQLEKEQSMLVEGKKYNNYHFVRVSI